MQYPLASRLADEEHTTGRQFERRPVSHKTQIDQNYLGYSTIAGPMSTSISDVPSVQFRRILSGREQLALGGLVMLNVIAAVTFLGWLLSPSHLPIEANRHSTLGLVAGLLGFTLIAILEITRLSQAGVLALFASRMRDPIPMVPERGLRIAVLTTIVPSKEPIALVARTLRAMRELQYHGPVDVWILDEGDDPNVRAVARELGVRHFSRHGRPEYNQPGGAFRAKSKAGNHNAWRALHEHDYDIVAQMDPDHVPTPDFLLRTLGYFRDRDVAFVVAPQVYGNSNASFVSRGAADQSYLFHGVIQRGGNGLDAPLLIGTNHLYRTSALRQIGGYQDSVIEDHLTSLTLHASTNPVTRNRWKGIYTPDILAIGEGPERWTDYFNQQQRWAYGIWHIVRNQSSRLLRQLTWSQRLAYIGLESFYPSVAVVWALGNTLTMLYLTFGVTAIALDRSQWALLWTPTVLLQLALFFWLRRFNLAAHERQPSGALSGLLLSLATGPIYVAAGASSLMGKPLTYVVTAKSSLASSDSLRTFRLHAGWMAAMLAGLAISVVSGYTNLPLRAWAVFTLIAAACPVVHHLACRQPRVLLRMPRVQPARLATVATATVLPIAVVFSFGAGFALPRAEIGETRPAGLQRDPFQRVDHDEPASAKSPDTHVSAGAGGDAATRSVAPIGSPTPEPPRLSLPGEVGRPVLYGVFSESEISASGDINQVFYQWNEPASSFAGFVDYSASTGRVALISWEPRSGPILREPAASDVAILSEIANGTHDAHILEVARAVNGTRHPVIIRFAFEMDLEATGLHPWAGQEPERYREAYRRVVDLFRETGADQVAWLWSPSAMTDDAGELIAMPYYPGAAYVDYVGFSAFLYWKWEEWSDDRKRTHAFRTPDEYFRRPLTQLAGLGKPIIIPEMGVSLHPSMHDARVAWLTEAAELLVNGAYPGVVAVVYFDTKHNWDGNQADWRLTRDEMRRFAAVFETQMMTRPSDITDGRESRS